MPRRRRWGAGRPGNAALRPVWAASRVWLDRSRKLPTLLASKLTAALALSSITLAYWSGVLSIGWLYGVAFVMGCTSVFGVSAEQVFLTTVVGRDRLVEAHARFATTVSASRLLGPGLAGMLVQLLSAPVALRQRHTPDHYLGRVNSTMRFLTVAVAPIGSVTTGLIADHFGIRTAQLCVGGASLVLTAVVFKASPLPRIRE